VIARNILYNESPPSFLLSHIITLSSLPLHILEDDLIIQLQLTTQPENGPAILSKIHPNQPLVAN